MPVSSRMKRLRGALGGLAGTAFAVLAGAGPVGAQPLGEASCKASARGECPELSDRTFYFPSAGMLIYYAPSGTSYQAETTEITQARWWVDETGRQVRRRLPFAGTTRPLPIASLTEAPSVPGDPAKLSSKTGGFAIQPYDERTFETIIEEAAAR